MSSGTAGGGGGGGVGVRAGGPSPSPPTSAGLLHGGALDEFQQVDAVEKLASSCTPIRTPSRAGSRRASRTMPGAFADNVTFSGSPTNRFRRPSGSSGAGVGGPTFAYTLGSRPPQTLAAPPSLSSSSTRRGSATMPAGGQASHDAPRGGFGSVTLPVPSSRPPSSSRRHSDARGLRFLLSRKNGNSNDDLMAWSESDSDESGDDGAASGNGGGGGGGGNPGPSLPANADAGTTQIRHRRGSLPTVDSSFRRSSIDSTMASPGTALPLASTSQGSRRFSSTGTGSRRGSIGSTRSIGRRNSGGGGDDGEYEGEHGLPSVGGTGGLPIVAATATTANSPAQPIPVRRRSIGYDSDDDLLGSEGGTDVGRASAAASAAAAGPSSTGQGRSGSPDHGDGTVRRRRPSFASPGTSLVVGQVGGHRRGSYTLDLGPLSQLAAKNDKGAITQGMSSEFQYRALCSTGTPTRSPKFIPGRTPSKTPGSVKGGVEGSPLRYGSPLSAPRPRTGPHTPGSLPPVAHSPATASPLRSSSLARPDRKPGGSRLRYAADGSTLTPTPGKTSSRVPSGSATSSDDILATAAAYASAFENGVQSSGDVVSVSRYPLASAKTSRRKLKLPAMDTSSSKGDIGSSGGLAASSPLDSGGDPAYTQLANPPARPGLQPVETPSGTPPAPKLEPDSPVPDLPIKEPLVSKKRLTPLKTASQGPVASPSSACASPAVDPSEPVPLARPDAVKPLPRVLSRTAGAVGGGFRASASKKKGKAADALRDRVAAASKGHAALSMERSPGVSPTPASPVPVNIRFDMFGAAGSGLSSGGGQTTANASGKVQVPSAAASSGAASTPQEQTSDKVTVKKDATATKAVNLAANQSATTGRKPRSRAHRRMSAVALMVVSGQAMKRAAARRRPSSTTSLKGVKFFPDSVKGLTGEVPPSSSAASPGPAPSALKGTKLNATAGSKKLTKKSSIIKGVKFTSRLVQNQRSRHAIESSPSTPVGGVLGVGFGASSPVTGPDGASMAVSGTTIKPKRRASTSGKVGGDGAAPSTDTHQKQSAAARAKASSSDPSHQPPPLTAVVLGADGVECPGNACAADDGPSPADGTSSQQPANMLSPTSQYNQQVAAMLAGADEATRKLVLGEEVPESHFEVPGVQEVGPSKGSSPQLQLPASLDQRKFDVGSSAEEGGGSEEQPEDLLSPMSKYNQQVAAMLSGVDDATRAMILGSQAPDNDDPHAETSAEAFQEDYQLQLPARGPGVKRPDHPVLSHAADAVIRTSPFVARLGDTKAWATSKGSKFLNGGDTNPGDTAGRTPSATASTDIEDAEDDDGSGLSPASKFQRDVQAMLVSADPSLQALVLGHDGDATTAGTSGASATTGAIEKPQPSFHLNVPASLMEAAFMDSPSPMAASHRPSFADRDAPVGSAFSAVDAAHYAHVTSALEESGVSEMEMSVEDFDGLEDTGYGAEAPPALDMSQVCEACQESGGHGAHFAALMGHLECLEVLVEDPHFDAAGSDNMARTPLFYAASENHVDCCALLVDVRPEWMDTGDTNGDTPLHVAVIRGHEGVVELLLQSGCQAALANAQGLTPIHVVKSDSCLTMLLDFGAAPNHVDYNGRSPLFTMSALGRASSVVLLLESHNGSQFIQLPDSRGDTPLHAAACYGRRKCLRILLEHGADPCARNMMGFSPKDLAIMNGHEKCAKLLEYVEALDVGKRLQFIVTSGKMRILYRESTRKLNLNPGSADDESQAGAGGVATGAD